MYRFVETPGSVPLSGASPRSDLPGAMPGVPPNAGPAEMGRSMDTLTPAMLSRMVWRRKGVVIAFGLAFAAAGLAYGVLAPPKYIAYSQIIVDPIDLRVTDKALSTPSQFADALIAQVENQARVITSSKVLDRVIAAEHLDEDEEFNGRKPPGFIGEIAASLRGLVGGSGKGKEIPPALVARRNLEQEIGAKRDERTYVVNVSAKTGEQEKSVRLADAIVDAYLAENGDTRDAVAKKVASSLNGRIGDLKGAVEQAERQVEEYRRSHNMLAAVGSSVTEQQLADASTRLQTAQTAVAQAQSRFNQVQQAKSSGDIGAMPDALQSSTVMTLRTQLTEAQRRTSDVMATRGPRHPEVIEIKAQEGSVRRALVDELGRIAITAKTNLDRVKADEAEMRRSFDRLKAAVNAQDEAAVRLRELERDVAASRSVYEAFMNRTKEVSEQVDVANVRVIGRAQLPERRASPPRTLLLIAGGLVLGLLLGAGLAMLRGLMRGETAHTVRRRRPVPAMALVRA